MPRTLFLLTYSDEVFETLCTGFDWSFRHTLARCACLFQNLVWTRPHVHMSTGAPETSLLVAFEEIQFSKVGTPYCTWFLVSTKHRLARCRLCSKLSRLDRPDNASGLKPNPLEPVARRGRRRFTYTSPWESWGWFRWPEREDFILGSCYTFGEGYRIEWGGENHV